MHETVLEIVRSEDYRVARDTWRSLSHAPPDFEVQLGRSEPLLQHYHRDLEYETRPGRSTVPA